jgi:hypothetical protein
MSKYSLDIDYFRDIDTPQKAYWLGFIAADGCISYSEEPYKKHNTLIVGLQKSDYEHLELFKSHLNYGGPLSFPKEAARLAISSKVLVGDLMSHGITPRKSLTAEAWRGPDDLMPHYWRGVFDGDGFVYPTQHKSGCTIWTLGICGSRQMMDSFQQFILSVANVEATVRADHTIWKVVLSGLDKAQRVAKVLYTTPTPSLSRKQTTINSLLSTQKYDGVLAGTPVENLISTYRDLGSWRKVATSIGTRHRVVIDYLNRHGVDHRALLRAA